MTWREGDLADQLDGSSVRCVAAPRDLDSLVAMMAMAGERGLTVLPRGSGSKISWLDLPVNIDLLIHLSGFTDLRFDIETDEVTVGAGTPLAVVQDELARLGRRITLDPPSLRATVGGTLVTAEAGPLSHLFGPPAAQLTDATVVLPDGTINHVRERVQLLGSGVCDLRWVYPGFPNPACAVAEVTLRTHPLPGSQAWLTCPVSQPLHVAELLTEITAANVSPSAIELDLPGIRMGAGAVVPGQRHATGALSVLIEGAEGVVADRVRQLARRLGDKSHVSDEMPQWWGRYPFRAGEVAVRLNAPDGLLHVVCYALADAAGGPIPVRGSLGGGPGWAALPGDMLPRRMTAVLDAVRGVLLARGGSAVVQSAPSELKEVVAPYRRP